MDGGGENMGGGMWVGEGEEFGWGVTYAKRIRARGRDDALVFAA
jgi:hypothetical protein